MNLHKFSLFVIIPCFVFSDGIKSDQSGNTVAHISRAKLVKLVIQRKQPTSDPDLKRDQPCFVFASHGPEKSVELESYSPQSPKYAFMLVPAGTVIVSGAGASVPVIGQVVGAAIGTALAISWLVDFIKHKKPSMKEKGKNVLQNDPRSCTGGPDKDPDDDDDLSGVVGYFVEALKHIFRDEMGHLKDTPENRKLLLSMASKAKNRLGVDRYGNIWYGEILRNGKQLWAWVRDNLIRDGGINEIPRVFNERTGLCRPIIFKK